MKLPATFFTVITLFAVAPYAGWVLAEDPYPVEWTRQIGTIFDDESHSVAVDASGNAYISGFTGGSLEGTNAGNNDAFLTKFDSSGNKLWGKQIGTLFRDESNSVAVDALGNAYISGYTGGSLEGTNAGQDDAFLMKFSAPSAAVPEPSSLVLVAVGATPLLLRRRRHVLLVVRRKRQ